MLFKINHLSRKPSILLKMRSIACKEQWQVKRGRVPSPKAHGRIPISGSTARGYGAAAFPC